MTHPVPEDKVETMAGECRWDHIEKAGGEACSCGWTSHTKAWRAHAAIMRKRGQSVSGIGYSFYPGAPRTEKVIEGLPGMSIDNFDVMKRAAELDVDKTGEILVLLPLENVRRANVYAKKGYGTIELGLPLEAAQRFANGDLNAGGLILLNGPKFRALKAEMEASLTPRVQDQSKEQE